MRSFEDLTINGSEAAREGVLDVAAKEVLLQEADEEKTEQPKGAVAKDTASKEETSVDDEEAGFSEDEDEERKERRSPGEAGEEAGGLVEAAEAVDSDGAALDLRHDPGDDDDPDELKALDGEQKRGSCGSVLVVLQVDQMQREREWGGEENDEEEQAPAGAQAFVAEEDAAQGAGSGFEKLVFRPGEIFVGRRFLADVVQRPFLE